MAQSVVNVLDYNPYANRGMIDASVALQSGVFDVGVGSETSGYTIFLPPGIFLIQIPVLIPYTVNIQGAGVGITTVLAAPGLNSWVFWFVPLQPPFIPNFSSPQYESRNASGRFLLAMNNQYNAAGRMNVSAAIPGITATFRDLTIDGNASQQTSGGCINASGAVHCVFDNVEFTRPYDVGLSLDQIGPNMDGGNNNIQRCLFNNGNISAGNGQGLRIANNHKNKIDGCEFNGNGGAGAENYQIKDSGNYNLIQGCQFSLGHESIRLNGTAGSRVLANTFDNVGRACVHSTGANGNVSNNVMLNGCTDTANTYSHVEVEGSLNRVIGNYHVNTVPGQVKYFYNEWSSAADKNVISSNTYNQVGATGAGAVNTLGALSITSHNPGFNPVGPLAGIVLPLSGSFSSNNTGVDCTVIVHSTSGSITQILIDAVDTSLTSGAFFLPVGNTIKIIFTGTIAWTWFGN